MDRQQRRLRQGHPAHRPGRRRSRPRQQGRQLILAVGVTAVEGDFERDDLVRILSPDGAQLAVGRISCDSATARRNIGRKGLKPLVHCDYLYLE